MKKGSRAIFILILFGLIGLVGVYRYIGPKVTLMEIQESLGSIPLKIQSMNLNLVGVDYNEYPTRQQILRKGKKAIVPFTHSVECSSRCQVIHEESYNLKTDFNRLDKRVDVEGKAYESPYVFSIYNRKEEGEYNLYYDINIDLLGREYSFKELQKAINQVGDTWGVDVSQTICINGIIAKRVSQEEQEQYTKEIFKGLGAYSRKDYKVNSPTEDIYYGYITHFRKYEVNECGNKYNVVIKFIFNGQTQETQMTIEFPSKI